MGADIRSYMFVRLTLAAVAVALILVPNHRALSGEDRPEGITCAYTVPTGIATPPHSGATCLLAGRPAGDFKLRDAIAGRSLTFLDTSRKDFTFLYFLDTRSAPCLDSLNFLAGVRERYRDRIGLVAVFLDPAGEGEVVRYLITHGIIPDYALHDPAMVLGRRFGISTLPALQVVGPEGTVLFRGRCARPVDISVFAGRLEHVLQMTPAGWGTFLEARRIYGEAKEFMRKGDLEMAALFLRRVLELQPTMHTVNCLLADVYRDMDRRRDAAVYYARYLGADIAAYDFAEVKERVRSLTE